MSVFQFLDEIKRVPAPFEATRAENALADFKNEVDNLDRFKDLASQFIETPGALDLLASIFGNSPYLTRLLLLDIGGFLELMHGSSQASFSKVIEEMHSDVRNAGSRADAMKALRIAKRKMALLVAIADISGAWELAVCTQALTDFADGALQASLRYLMREQIAKGKFTPADLEKPEVNSGFIVLAMGKYGAGELNYSSDIDIIVFFEPDLCPVAEGVEAQALYIRITKDLVKMMQQKTGDGYVFRTDLRLRPDAGATAVALSTPAAAFYYETMGQNWERAAMIKARAAAGDLVAGEVFLSELAPFVWRRYLDYAAIEDIHSIKRQIHAHKGHAKIAIEGHNVKLGRGGIREIEFFAQTQQLIGGGRDSSLRERTTNEALNSLANAGTVKRETAEQLQETYRFLREVEHRIQMVNDEQTHRLPETEEGVSHIATFCGFASSDDFRRELRNHLERVQGHYAELFEEEPTLGKAEGNLVFTGVEDDPGTLETLLKMGFERPSDVTETIRGWHHGRLRLMRSERARALLTKLIPHLLEAMSRTSDPDAAMANFHRFLAGLPAGVQLFSMLHSNPHLMILLAEILGTAPRLASVLSKTPGVLDALLDQKFFGPFPSDIKMKAELQNSFDQCKGFEEKLDAARIWAREMRFRIGANVLNAKSEASEVGPALTSVADTIVSTMQPAVIKELAIRHGEINGAISVIAMGKMGSREMSSTSDLDLIFVYETDDPDAQSIGQKSLHATQYFARVSQRVISSLSAPTAEGQLYEVDARLRPSGNSGPLAVSFEGFSKYQREEAWTWEKMALTRARVITGSSSFRDRLESEIKMVLCRSRDRAATLNDVSEMRARIWKEKATDDVWDLKHVRGGLVDLEFIAQGLQLIHASAKPEILSPNTTQAFEKLGHEKLIGNSAAVELVEASKVLHQVTQVLRICVEGAFDPSVAPDSLKRLLARAGGATDFSELEDCLRETRRIVKGHFDNFIEIGNP